jgi:sulfur carrier protein
VGRLLLMEVRINGKPTSLPEGQTIAQLVAAMELADKRVAIEVNEQIVPRSTYPQHILCPGDRVEVVTAIGGG